MKKEETKVKSNKREIVYRWIAVLLLSVLCISILPQKANAATLSIRYDGKTTNYTGTQAKVTIDGSSVDLKGTPGIIINDTNMVSYYDVFKSGLKATTSYVSSTKKLTISYYNITVEMTVGSKTAYVNGVAKTLDAAPKSIYFSATKKTKIYVPAGSVAKALGCTYVWNSSTKTGQITSPYILKIDGEWTIYTGTKGKVTYNNKSISLGKMPGIIKDGTVLLSAAKVFKTGLGASYSYNSSTKEITISQNDNQIQMTVGSLTATVNGEAKTLSVAPKVVTVKSTGTNYVLVPGKFVATNLGYDYEWNSSTGTSVITKGTSTLFEHEWSRDTLSVSTDVNMLTKLKAITTSATDQITFESSSDISPTITQDAGTSYIYVDISNIYTNETMVSLVENISNGTYLKQFSAERTDTGIRYVMAVSKGCEYYTIDTDSAMTIVLCEGSVVTGSGTTGSDNENRPSEYQMKVSLPTDVAFSKVTTADHYESKYFTITMPGDWVDYFTNNPITFDSSVVSKVSCSLNSSGKTVIKVTTPTLQGFRLYEETGYIGVEIGDPTDVYENIVVLDAGHGGTDPGTSKGSTKEKDLNFQIIYTLAKKYFDSADSPVKAYWTRKTDTFVALTTRASFADTVGADLFVSLHMNSASSSSAKGMEVLYASNNKNTLGSANTKKIASEYSSYLLDTLEMTGRTSLTVDRTKLVVLYKNTVPSVLIELGFLSNSSDLKKLTDDDFQDLAAKSIYEATVQVFEKYPTGR